MNTDINISYGKRLSACAYYFIAPGIAYGSLTSRMPAIMQNTHSDTRQIGLMLFALGATSIVSLMLGPKIIGRFGSNLMLFINTILMLLVTVAIAFAVNSIQLIILAALVGLFIGIIDVAMNTQGILLEKHSNKKSMSKLHAFYSLGAVCAALFASLLAKLNIGVELNFIILFGIYILGSYISYKYLVVDKEQKSQEVNNKAKSIKMPMLVYICGIVSLLVYAIEGSVGEWGSLYLFHEKGADEATAALVYAFFSICAVASKLMIDNIRNHVADSIILTIACTLSFICYVAVLYVDNSIICLILYAIVGFAIAPVVPIAFSVAGAQEGVSAKDASATVARLAYTGLLFFPPMLGFLAKALSLQIALHVVLIQIFIVLILSYKFRLNTKVKNRV